MKRLRFIAELRFTPDQADDLAAALAEDLAALVLDRIESGDLQPEGRGGRLERRALGGNE